MDRGQDQRRAAAVKHTAAVLAALALLAGSAARADPEEPWQFSVTPYLWLPYVDADLGFETGGSGGATVEMSDLLKHLSGAFFLNADARKGRWGLNFDLVYCDFSKADSNVTNVTVPGRSGQVPVNLGTTTGLTGYMLSLEGSYALVRSPHVSFDLLGGARYTHIGATLAWNFSMPVDGLPGRAGSTEKGSDLWDGVVGVSGRMTVRDSHWFVPLYLDAGTGSSTFTWQGLLGLGYAFRWGDALLAYRYLSFEQGAEAGVRRLTFSGPALGATFRF